MIRWAVAAAAAVAVMYGAEGAGDPGIPDCTLAPGWTQSGPSRTYEGENLFEYMNGNSEGYFIYGFVRMHGVTCKKDGITLNIDISEMADPESAYGMFTANRDQQRPIDDFGMGAQIVPRKAIVAKDKYYVEIAAEPEGDHTALLRALSKTQESRIPGETGRPAALAWFPAEGVVTGTPRLIPQSVLGIGVLKRGYMAQYENRSKAFVVTETSPETAKTVMTKLAARFGESAPAKVPGADDAFTANDKYLGRICVFRKANRVGGYVGVPEGADALQVSAALASKLP